MRSKQRPARRGDLRAILLALMPRPAAAKSWKRALILAIVTVCVVSAAGAMTIFAGEPAGNKETTPDSLAVFQGSTAVPPDFAGAPVTSGTRTVLLKADGAEKRLTTSQVRVFDVLEEAGIALGEQDEVFPNGSSGLLENMEIVVTRVTEETQELTVEVPFETVYTQTPTLFEGETLEVQAGKPGQRIITMVQVLRDGLLSEHRVINSALVAEPRDQIVWIGTKKRPAETKPATKATTKATTKAASKTTKATTAATAPPTVNSITTAGGTTYTFTKKLNGDSVAYYSTSSKPMTATGNPAIPGKTIAVDPSFIPLGSLVYITSVDGKSWSYGPAYAHDVGGGIKGNIIDLFQANYADAVAHGRRDCIIYILKP